MTGKRLTLPEQKVREYAHELAYKLACERLANIQDIEKQCGKTGTKYVASEKAIIVDYLNKSYRIRLPDVSITLTTGKEDVSIKDKILILDYFSRAKGTPLTGKTITYKELHDGLNYFSVFASRTINPIVSYFGEEPESLPDIAAVLGGRKAEPGDVSVTIDAFPRVPITIVLWRGDAEFGPEASILFDSTVSDYLSNDDIHTLCENITWSLVRILKSGGDNPGNR
jgi:hypothetical protein